MRHVSVARAQGGHRSGLPRMRAGGPKAGGVQSQGGCHAARNYDMPADDRRHGVPLIGRPLWSAGSNVRTKSPTWARAMVVRTKAEGRPG